MKKLLLSLLFLVGGIVGSSAATYYNISVGGVKVTSDNASNVTGSGITGGTVSYNASTNTLTLTKASILVGDDYALYCNNAGLKIVIDGSVSVKSTGAHGIGIVKNTTITGKDFNASLRVYGATTSTWRAIWVTYGSTLTLKNLWAYVTGGNMGIDGYYNDNGTTYRGSLYLDCCYLDVELANESATESCVTGFKEIVTWGVTYDYNGYIYSSYKLVNSSGNNVKSHYFEPRMAVGRFIFNPSSNITLTSSSVGSGIQSGSVVWSSTYKELQLEDAVIETPNSFNGIGYYGLSGDGDVDIWLDGASSIKTLSGGACIVSYNRDLIIGGQSVSAGDKLTLTAEGTSAIVINGGKKLTLDGAEFVINGKTNGIYGNGSNTLAINKCKITSEATDYYGISGFKSCTMTDCCVNTSLTPVYFNADLKTFTDLSYNYAKKVAIGIPTATYSIDVSGVGLNNLNATNVIVPALKSGKISYSNSSKLLTLDGVTFTDLTSNNPAFNIKTACSATLVGENKITSQSDCFDLSEPLTIKGSGSIDATSNNESGITTRSNGRVTLESTNYMSFTGAKYGYYGSRTTDEVLTLKKAKSDNYGYVFIGTQGAIHNLTKLDMSQSGYEMDHSYSSLSPNGVYFDGKDVVGNDGNIYKGRIGFMSIKESTGLNVAGKTLNRVNSATNNIAVGSKYIKAGGGKAALYNPSTKTLTLTDIDINMYDEAQGGAAAPNLQNFTVDGLTINVVGNCTFAKTAGWVETGFSKNTTIQGSGKLTVDGELYTSGNGNTLTLKDVNIEAKYLHGAMGSDATSTLVVDLTTAGKTVSVSTYVEYWTTLTLENGTKIVTPDGAYFDAAKKWVAKADGTKAKGIVFGDKNATAIDAVKVASDAEVKQIFDASGRETSTAKRGLNIIRMSDGSVRKVMVK